MKKLLSLIALTFAMALAVGGFAPQARAAAVPAGVATLKDGESGVVQKARCWETPEGYERCGWRPHRHWRHHGYWRHHGWRHRHWRHHGWRHHGWRHRYWWRRHHGYGRDEAWRERYARRHYYYQSYTQPAYRSRYRPALYCIGICWW